MRPALLTLATAFTVTAASWAAVAASATAALMMAATTATSPMSATTPLATREDTIAVNVTPREALVAVGRELFQRQAGIRVGAEAMQEAANAIVDHLAAHGITVCLVDVSIVIAIEAGRPLCADGLGFLDGDFTVLVGVRAEHVAQHWHPAMPSVHAAPFVPATTHGKMWALAFDDIEAAHHRRQVGIGDAAVAIEVHTCEHPRDVGFDLGLRHGAITILIEAVHHAHASALASATAAPLHAAFHARGDALFGFRTIDDTIAVFIPAREPCAGLRIEIFLCHRTAPAATPLTVMATMSVAVTAFTSSVMLPAAAAAAMTTLPAITAALGHCSSGREACCCDRDATDDPDRFSHNQCTFPLFIEGFGGTTVWPILSLHTH